MYFSPVAVAPHASLRGRGRVVTGWPWTRDGTAACLEVGRPRPNVARLNSHQNRENKSAWHGLNQHGQKCQREKSPDRQMVHPVSCLSGERPFLSVQHQITHVHKVSSVKKQLFEFGVEERDWPAQNPDLNPSTAPLRKQT